MIVPRRIEARMRSIFFWITEKLEKQLNLKSRLMLLLAAICLVPSFFTPLWSLEFWSYQYPEGLNLYIYSHKLVGGNDGNDLKEINILNHYIGMAALEEEDFLELKWIPLAMGIFITLTLRAMIMGRIKAAIDVLMMFSYFGAFSLWSFWYKLHYYGHNLDPRASVKVDPFMPPVFGFEQVGQFKVWSYPGIASYFLALFSLLLVLAIIFSLDLKRKKSQS